MSFKNLSPAAQFALQIAGVVGVIVTMTLAYANLKEQDAVFASKMQVLEQAGIRAQQDHDLLIEIRTDVKQLRAHIEQQSRRERFGAAQ